MTTKNSPLRVIKAQADKMAMIIKAASRGEFPDTRFVEKMKSALEKPSVKFAVAMDDKVISVEMQWDNIRKTSEVALSEYIVKLMREEREAS